MTKQRTLLSDPHGADVNFLASMAWLGFGDGSCREICKDSPISLLFGASDDPGERPEVHDPVEVERPLVCARQHVDRTPVFVCGGACVFMWQKKHYLRIARVMWGAILAPSTFVDNLVLLPCTGVKELPANHPHA